MSVLEPVSAEAERGVIALDHMLTCREIGQVFGPRAQAGDPEAVEVIRRAAQHMRRLKGA